MEIYQYIVYLKSILMSISIYMAAKWNFSVLWIIIAAIYFTYRAESKKHNISRRDFYRKLNDEGEQQVLEKLPDMPAWVYFPDFEKVEWLNRITQQLWPYVNHFGKDLIKESIEPVLKDTLSGYQLKGFKFERIVLGSQPFRIGGVKVYSIDNQRDEIMMDFNVAYSGDCNISFQLFGMKGGVKNFQLYGRLRVVLKPLLRTMPLAGGVQAYFLKNPDIDFDLFGVAQLLDTPALNEILKKCVSDIIASMIVLPNKFYIQLSSEQIKEATIEKPHGVLRVHLLEANNLEKKDFKLIGKGKSDPYAILRVGSQTKQSRTIDDNVNPKWDEWFEFEVTELKGQNLFVELFDKDATDDEFLGSCVVGIENVIAKGEVDMNIALSKVKHGSVYLRLKWLSLGTDSSDLDDALTNVKEISNSNVNSSIITVVVDSASHIQAVKSSKNPDPYVVITVGKNSSKTKSKEKTTTPVWEEGYTFFLGDPRNERVQLKILDQKTDTVLGEFLYPVKSLLEKTNLEIVQQPFELSNGVKIVLSMYLRIFKRPNVNADQATDNKDAQDDKKDEVARRDSVKSDKSNSPVKPEEKSSDAEVDPSTNNNNDDSSTPAIIPSPSVAEYGRIYLTKRYVPQRQRLIIIVHKVEGIPYKDPDNWPNLYVKLYILPDRTKDYKRKTKIIKSTISPIYDETLEYVLSEAELPSKQLEISVIHDKVMKNPIFGQVVLDLKDLEIGSAVSEWHNLNPIE